MTITAATYPEALDDVARHFADIARLLADIPVADLKDNVRARIFPNFAHTAIDPLLFDGPVLKMISMWNPWAALLAAGEKWIETRGWPTKHRGTIGIQAAKKYNAKASEKALQVIRDQYDWTPRHAKAHILLEEGHHHGGRLVAIATLEDCVPTENVRKIGQPISDVVSQPRQVDTPAYFQTESGAVLLTDGREAHVGNLNNDRFAWLLSNVRAVVHPPEVRGQQGMWNHEPEAPLLTIPV